MKNVTSRPITPTPVRDHRDLQVWQRSIQLVVETYRLTSMLPETERYGLTLQLRRATVAIAANISEGHGRLGRGECVRGLSYARGELKEAETLLYITEVVGYLAKTETVRAWSLADEVSRMLAVLIRQLRAKRSRKKSDG